jgi:putative acetyltransferase
LAGTRGAEAVFVLGRSSYYAPLGFAAAAPLGWRCTYDAPTSAFRVTRLGDAVPPPGTVRYHPAFDAL